MSTLAIHRGKRRRFAAQAGIRLLVACALFTGAAGDGSSRTTLNKFAPGPGNVGATLYLRNVAIHGPFAPGTVDHPLFYTSYTGEANRIVARTKYGDINARDFYLWLIMREGPHKAYLLESFDKARTTTERDEIATAIRAEIDEYVFTNYVIPELMGNAPCDGVAALKELIYLLPAYQLVYIQSVLEPTLCIEQADRVKYLQEHKAEVLQPERFRTRYIFMESSEVDPLEEQDAVEDEMTTLREEIVAGKLTFSDAARTHSQAPSAGQGGEIPVFKAGELFFFYEDAAKGLQPGEVSRVFRGPRGYYMVQLIENLPPAEPNLNDPEQAKKVDEALSRQVLREAYDWDLRSLYLKYKRPRYNHGYWDKLEDTDIVGEICGLQVTKHQLRDAFPELEGDDLKLRTGLIDTWLHTIIERAAMAIGVDEHGKQNEYWVQRGRWMAANIVRRDGYIDRLRCGLQVSESVVQNFWKSNPRLFTPLALKRLIKVTLAPLNTAPLPSQTRDELQRVLVDAGSGAPTVAITRDELQAEEISAGQVVRESLMQTEQVFQALEEDAPATTEPQTEILPEILPVDKPVNAGVMIPGLEPLPSPGAITSGTLTELRGGGISEPAQGGGCVPLSPGVAPPPLLEDPPPGTIIDESESSEMLPPRVVTRPSGAYEKVYSAPAAAKDVEFMHENWRGPVLQPPPAPDCKPLPPGVVAPAVGPQLELRRAPNENKQLPPPETSNHPFNPDWFFARLDSTILRQVVRSYASSDFVLRYNDLGYVYTEDVPEIPAGVEAVPVGAFSKPYIVDNKAVSYYVEDARTVEKPPFEQIKSQAYSTYQQVETDKALQRTYKQYLGNAGIDYSFEKRSTRTASK